ncbi:endonuclease/exonuclease/phosphatase family protein [Pseudoalteromonas sp. SCSIO 43201]|uniref:endonuclease/exonuclease/phosphatase family protein n=1 Tax=Pseudoalteromonas TaxID=53246 RepID=UPI002075751E|nr:MULTISPECIES: endonuclease/exonuclease/phosphatase family protein [Pseudoalteromonas]MDW7547699.1 endonuclease/exonuclease/phosphatase family protein [Pseudoalteromonas peptidolytica]USD27678.1 endonuclease/exonuclease/phosphatase family protein [Pseudoalteromonas sp. SCSIO 43201]
MTWIIVSLSVVILVATLLPLAKHPHWSVRAMEFPRLQLVTMTAVALMLCIVFFKLSLLSVITMFVLTACLCFQLWWILPYTPLWPVEVKHATSNTQTMSILTANVLQTNRQFSLLLSQVRAHQPDILITLESDEIWQQHLDSLLDILPYSVKCPQSNLYGMHVYSRHPLEDATCEYIVEEGVPSIHAKIKLPSNTIIQAHFLHPAPPSPTENKTAIERDAELVIVAKRIAKHALPTIVTGDLNDVAWSPTTRLFRKISGLLDPRVGRGMFNTFHADYPFARWPLDHLFSSHHFTVVDIKRLANIGSDHFALYAELAYQPVENENTTGLDLQRKDINRSEEILARAKAKPNIKY